MGLQKVQTDDKNLELLQNNVEKALQFQSSTIDITMQGTNPVHTKGTTNAPFLGGNLVSVSLLSGQDNLVPHGLQRLPEVWTLADIDVSSTVWSPQTTALASSSVASRSSNEQFLNLQCSTSCNISVWIN